MQHAVHAMLNAANWDDAEKSGRIVPGAVSANDTFWLDLTVVSSSLFWQELTTA